MSKWTPRFLAFMVGLLSLSQEILCTRLIAFTHQAKPQAFAVVLGYFLFGIAIGAAFGRRVCRTRLDLVRFSGWWLCVAGLVDVGSLAVYAQLHVLGWEQLGLLIVLVIPAAMKSVLFPIVHHLGSNDVSSRQGVSFSRVYFANVMGSTLGPLITGLFLLDRVTMQQAFVLVGALTTVLGAITLWMAKQRLAAATLAPVATFLCALLWLPNVLPVILATPRTDAGVVGHVMESKEGIIHTRADPKRGDMVFGGNAYDGRISTNLTLDSNDIGRAYSLAAVHGHPRRVLVIGVSGGAWLQVMAMFPSVQAIDAVEINPTYLKLIKEYPEVSAVLTDPRITFHIDDGRRFLRSHPDDKYDLIVMNTIHHWRSNATNLVSQQFMHMAKDHLAPGGILSMNTTMSPDVVKTASTVFNNAYGYESMVVASDHDFRASLKENRAVFTEMQFRDRPVFDLSKPGDAKAVQRMIDVPFVTVDALEENAHRSLEVITDDNMITEYKLGLGFY